MNLFTLSWKNLANKPLSMLLSLVLFALGVGLISLLFLLNQQLQDKFDKNLAGIDLVVGAKGSPLQLILSSMYHIDAPTGNISIKEATPFLRPGHPLIQTAVPLSMGDSHKGYRIVGTTPDILGLYEAEVAEGRVWNATLETTIGAASSTRACRPLGDPARRPAPDRGIEERGARSLCLFHPARIVRAEAASGRHPRLPNPRRSPRPAGGELSPQPGDRDVRKSNGFAALWRRSTAIAGPSATNCRPSPGPSGQARHVRIETIAKRKGKTVGKCALARR